MPEIGLGCGLTGALSLPGGADIAIPDIPLPITAQVVPVSAPLFEGQSLRDTAGFTTMTDPANYISGPGQITAVSVEVSGDAVSETTALSEGDVAAFAIIVSDDFGNTVRFETDPQTVEYAARLIPTTGNEAQLDLNPAVPGTATVTVEVSGNTGYDGQYDLLAADLRSPDPFALPGTVRVAFDGLSSGLGVGDTLHHDAGLWIAQNDLGFALQGLSDGTPVPGATGQSHVLTAAELGQPYVLQVTADDGNVPPVTVQSAPVPVPVIATAAVSTVERVFTDVGGPEFLEINLEMVPADAPMLFFAQARLRNGNHITGLTIDDVPATLIGQNDPAAGRMHALAFAAPRPNNPTPDVRFETSLDNATYDGGALTVFHVPGQSGIHAVAAQGTNGGTNTVDVSLNTASGSVVLFAGQDDTGMSTISVSGVGQLNGLSDSQDDYTTGYAAVALAESPRNIVMTTTGNSHLAAIAVCVI